MILIKVTKEHLEQGTKCNNKLCPVALALIELLKSEVSLTVGLLYLTLRHQGNSYQIRHNQENYISKFDLDEPVEPWEFELDIPQHLVK